MEVGETLLYFDASSKNPVWTCHFGHARGYTGIPDAAVEWHICSLASYVVFSFKFNTIYHVRGTENIVIGN